MKLPVYLRGLDFMSAKNSSEYVGTKYDNPAMVLEESVHMWSKTSTLEEIEDCFEIWQEKVCIEGFPARYSPQFWLAHAALSAIYNVLCNHVQVNEDTELHAQVDGLLLQLWVKLISAGPTGPGSTHLEMMDIVLKNQSAPLWRHMQTLKGDNLKLLLSTLKTDFVYKEEVSADHYATLMETHIDKIFRTILSSNQYEDCQRELLDVQIFYLSRLNHVPPHIGPRLSHLCFLICNRYELENPYVGMDDWVLTRHHLRHIKEVIIDPTFTKGSEAQYRAPRTLEKILQAAVLDGMLETVFRDFMSLLNTMCNYSNCRKCNKLFNVYQTGLFEQIDWKRGFEEKPFWLFDATIKTLIVVAGTDSIEPHIEDFIITTQNLCLMQFDSLTPERVNAWHDLLVSYVVSGRRTLTTEATSLLWSSLLERNTVTDWKKNLKEGKMLIDIVADLPRTFIQDDELSPLTATVGVYVTFIDRLFEQMKALNLSDEIIGTVERCTIRCMTKDSVSKAPILLACLQSDIINFQDSNFIREALFSIDKLLKEVDCTEDDQTLAKALTLILSAFMQYFSDKGFIATDFNSLLVSICVTCVSMGGNGHMTESHDTSHDIWEHLFYNVFPQFLNMHIEKGSTRSLSSLVPDAFSAVKDSLQQGKGASLLVAFLQTLLTSCKQLIDGHVTTVIELYLDWECFTLKDIVDVTYNEDPGPLIARFQDIYEYIWETAVDQRHHVIYLFLLLSKEQSQLFTGQHVSQLLDTYPYEMELTQSYILQIMANLADRAPSLIRGHYSCLTDDSKVSPLNIQVQTNILLNISRGSEDLMSRTMDFLMKHVDSKDTDVSTVAMATLAPIVKGSHFLLKNKQKFKNLFKSSSDPRIKQLCMEILPEIKSQQSSRQQSAKKSKPVPTQAKKEPPVRVKVEPKTAKKMPDVKPINGKVQLVSSKSADVANSSKETLLSPVKSGLKLDTKVQAGSDTHKREDLQVDDAWVQRDADIGISEKVQQNGTQTSDLSLTKKTVNDNVNKANTCTVALGQLTECDVKTNIVCKHNGDSVGESPISARTYDGKEEIGFGQSKVFKSDVVNINAETTLPGKENVLVLKKTVDESTKLDVYEGTKQDTSGDCIDISKGYSDQSVCTSIGILVTGEDTKAKMIQLSLKDLGFGSTICSTADSVDIFEGNFKLVFVCMTGTSNTAQGLLQKLCMLKDNSTPTLFLKLYNCKVPQELNVIGTSTHIRFFLKAGEKPYKNTTWPLMSFRELLMYINYYGIFPDQSKKANELAEILKENTGHDKRLPKDGETIHEYASPDIFISYKWGRQEQVEPLFNLLTKLGFHCWFGAHQVSGSESLYNKISQGLQGCRAVLICVTTGYTQAQNCQQEVTIAQNLGRPIIPLLLSNNITWPLPGEVGRKLTNYGYYRLDVGPAELDVSCSSFRKVLISLDKFIPNVVDGHDAEMRLKSNPSRQSLKGTMQEQGTTLTNCNATTQGNSRVIDVDSEGTSEENKNLTKPQAAFTAHRNLPKSSSMFELEMTRRDVEKEKPKYTSKTDDDLGIKERISNYGYNEGSMRSVRSKSCLIL